MHTSDADDVIALEGQLPVVDLEVGDSWTYGNPSDPLKMAQNRALQRVWIDCIATGAPFCQHSNPVIQNFTWALLKCPEHTWGTPGISGGNDYNVTTFRAQLNTSAYAHASASWAEQRFFNELAVRALEEAAHPLAAAARAELDLLGNVAAPAPQDPHAGYTLVPDPSNQLITTVTGTTVSVGLDGSVSSLIDKGTTWVTADKAFAGFTYKTFNETEWLPFTYAYVKAAPRPSRESARGRCWSAAAYCSRVLLTCALLVTSSHSKLHERARRN